MTICWQPIASLAESQKDGRDILLWDGAAAVIGCWDADRSDWEDAENLHLLEGITHWAGIDPPC